MAAPMSALQRLATLTNWKPLATMGPEADIRDSEMHSAELD